MGRFIELTGKKFGKLAVIEKTDRRPAAYWLCNCECGNQVVVISRHLINGKTKSCGCLRAIAVRKTAYRHGHSKTLFYRIWVGMMSRCYKPTNNRYNSYGGRGIIVCEDWKKSLETFYNWANNSGYKDGLTLDRINVNGNYEPKNCRWATTAEQGYNKQNSVYVNIKGISYTADDIHKMCGMSKSCFYRYSKCKMGFQEAIDKWRSYTKK